MASGGETGFTLAVATEAGAAEQLNQVLAAWEATSDRGVPLELVEVEHPTKYALDVRNKSAAASLVARFRNAAGEVLLALTKEAVTIGKACTFTGTVAFDGGLTLPDDAVDSDNYVDGSIDPEHLANNAVTDTKLRNSVNCSVIGRAANATGNPADIAAGADYTVLHRRGAVLGFGQIATPELEDDAVTTAKIPNRTRKFFVPATSNLTMYPRGAQLPDTATNYAYGYTAVPSDFVSGMKAKVLLCPDSSGQIRGENHADYAADGEDDSTHTATVESATITGLTIDTFKLAQELTLSSAAIGDFIELYFIRFGEDVEDALTDTVGCLGWWIEYTADS